MPVVSVVMPTYNMRRYLEEAIESVLEQTYTDFEFIVVDDGSTDGTEELVEKYLADPRMRYIKQANRGLSAARNTGIRHSNGAYIAFLDADDRWLPAKLALQMQAFAANPQVGIIHCNYQYINESGAVFSSDTRVKRHHPTLYEDLLYSNVVAGSGSAVVIRASCFEAAGLFDEQLPSCEDLDMWRRLALRYQFLLLEPVLVHIRYHENSMQRDLRRMTAGMLANLGKMQAEVPPEYRHHLPHAARQLYVGLALQHFTRRQFWRSLAFLLRICALGPRQIIYFLNDLRGFVARRRMRRSV